MKKSQKKTLIISLVIVLFVYLLLSFLIVDIDLEPIGGQILEEDHFFFEVYREGNFSMGGIFPGFGMIKNTTIENNRTYPVKVYFKPFGDISKFIYFDENPVYVGGNEKKVFGVHFVPQPGAALGTYKGKMLMIIYRWF